MLSNDTLIHTSLGKSDFTFYKISVSIIDIDECQLNLHTCDANAGCSNTIGSFNCQCNLGFTGNGFACAGKIKILYARRNEALATSLSNSTRNCYGNYVITMIHFSIANIYHETIFVFVSDCFTTSYYYLLYDYEVKMPIIWRIKRLVCSISISFWFGI